MKKIVFLFKRTLLVTFAAWAFKLPIKFPPIPSASAIIVKGGKILLIKLTYENGYALPGGVLQKQESFSEGMKREVFEETGLKVTHFSFFNSYYSQAKYPCVTNTYLVTAVGKLRPSKEGNPEFLSPKEFLSRMVFPDNRQALKDYLKKHA